MSNVQFEPSADFMLLFNLRERERERERMRVFWLLFLVIIAVRGSEESRQSISRDGFPKDFVFGSGTSAYQVIFLLF